MAPTLSEAYGDPVPDNLPTFWERFRYLVENYPEELALVAIHQPAGLYNISNVDFEDEGYKQRPYLRWSYNGLATAIDQFAAGLQILGARKGMPLITFVPNGAERMVAVFAANKLGCPYTAISTRNLVNMEETAHMIKICKLNATADQIVLIAQDPSLVEQIDTLPFAEDAIKVLVEGLAKAKGWVEFKDVLRGSKRHNDEVFSNGICHVTNDESVFFTSGTTSLPKGLS
jgi:acyl-CoA synthetase (AMP-forming)/AMP-acid ligase II